MQSRNDVGRNGGARVLLVSTNRERQPYPVVPNGLACVASALDAAGHRVRFLDLCFAADPVATAREAARTFRPDIIGLSVRNIDNSDAIALRHRQLVYQLTDWAEADIVADDVEHLGAAGDGPEVVLVVPEPVRPKPLFVDEEAAIASA